MLNSHTTKFIVGGGISGLIFAFYNKNFSIITEDIGGKLKNDFMKSTILLHDCNLTRKFLQDLGLYTIPPAAHIIKYFYKDKLYDRINIDLERLMVSKKLTLYNELEDVVKEKKITDTTLSSADVYIPIFEVDLDIIISKLSQGIDIIYDKVIRITKDEIITEGRRYPYSELVSTIDAPTFWRLYGEQKDFNFYPATYVYSDTNPLKGEQHHFDLIYFLDPSVKYTRVNKYKDDRFLYEFTGSMHMKDLKKYHPEINPLHHYIDDLGIIMTDLNNIPPQKVRFVGRFATWNHKYKIQDTIKDSIIDYDFISVWNKQREFNANFFDFNVQDSDLRQKLTKDFVLHIEDEAHELLSQINWKLDELHENLEVDRDRLIEEWIDIGKFWLGLGNVWGITMEEFFDAFWRKSEIVDTRYKKYFSPKQNGTQK